MNARVSAKLREKVQDDAWRNRTTLDVVVTAIVEDFFKSWTLTERAAFYRKFQGEGGK